MFPGRAAGRIKSLAANKKRNYNQVMAVAAVRAELESLLRARKLDRTLTTALPQAPVQPAELIIASGVPALDAAMWGGVPRGQVSELVGPASSGRTAVMHQWLAQTTCRGELTAVIDVLDTFDPEGAAARGVVLDRLLWVRCEGEDAVGRAIKALHLVISAGGFGLVVFDAAGVASRRLRQLPFTTWLRVQRVLEGTDTACVLLADAPLARSPSGASVRLGAGPGAGAPAPSADFHARVRANRYVTGAGPGASLPRRGAADPPVAARGVWQGGEPLARRFRGLATTADVQYALRGASCALVATEPQWDSR